MKMFEVVSNISLADSSSWEGKIFLTVDIDWASDDVLIYAVDLLERHNISATFFVTHNTPVLARLRSNPKFELGIHPNFNFLLNGDFRNGRCAEEVVDRLLNIVPEAKSVRSHSMTQSSILLDLFFEKGLTHESNHFIPEQLHIELRPWQHWAGLVKVPYFWEDDVYCLTKENSSMESLLLRKGLKVFDFHPIHIFLNTENMSRYNRCRGVLGDHEKLSSYINNDFFGTRDRLLELIA